MSAIDISTPKTILNTGVLQLQNGVAMDSTLRNVADQSNTTSPLKLSTSGVQVASTLQITTNSDPYIDAEDGAGNNRFTVGRDPSSQVVNIDFASNPTGGTNMVGGIRTYTDGVNLAQVMSFRKDGFVGIGTSSPILKTEIQSSVSGDVNIITSPYWNLYLSSQYTSAGMKLGVNGSSTGAIIQGTQSPNGVLAYGLMLQPFGGNTTFGTLNDLSAKLAIRGSGSTSATTSLLVQNSAGSTNLIATDDQVIKGYAGASLRFQFGGSSQAGISTRNGALCVGYIDGNFQNGLQISAEGTGLTYIDGWNDGGSLQYDIVIGRQGSRTQFGTYSASVSSAQVAINSTTRGFLPPRMTNAQRSAIASPAEGLQIHNTTNNGVAYYDGTNWGYLSGAKQSITITGATQTIFGGNGNIVALTMQSSTTLTFSNHVVGTYIFQITQGGTGSYTITWPVSVLWSGGTAPTLTTTVGKTDIVTLFHDGTNFYGTYSLNY